MIDPMHIVTSRLSATAQPVGGTSRRHFLRNAGTGLGSIWLSSLAQQQGFGQESMIGLPGHPHFKPRAKSVIWLFLRGGMSHLESFDPKPNLNKYAGKTIAETPWNDVQSPEKLKKVRVVVVNDANGQQRNEIFPLQVGFRPGGTCGTPVSDWFPYLRDRVDDIAVIRSMWTTDDNHGAQVQFHSGRHMLDEPVPTIGAWVNFGLGTLNENLPQFINMGPRFFDVRDGHYLGPAYDAIPLKVDLADPLPYAKPELAVPTQEQRIGFDLVHQLNQLTQQQFPDDAMLRARAQSYELAYRMQRAVPQVIDFREETEQTHAQYGLDHDATRPFGMQLLASRRFVEQGVRFIQIMHGDGAAGAWDAHTNLKTNHTQLCEQIDRPIAGLLTDLKQRGMLEETIVVLATEFGRTPGSQNGDGRDHHPYGFSVCMAGGGIRGGIVHGQTDEIGFHAAEHPHYVTDVHATIMELMGINPRVLEHPLHKRLEQDYGQPIREIMT